MGEEKTPEQLAEEKQAAVTAAEERVAQAQADLKTAQAEHDTSETAQALAQAKDEHTAAVAAHAELTTQKLEADKHILVQFGGTGSAVPVDIPEGSTLDVQGRCRERRLLVQGRNVEHVGEQGDIWVYREM